MHEIWVPQTHDPYTSRRVHTESQSSVPTAAGPIRPFPLPSHQAKHHHAMKPPLADHHHGAAAAELVKSRHLLRFALVFAACVAAFFLAKHWSDASPHLLFFSSASTPSLHTYSPSISISPNFNRSFDLSFLLNQTLTPDSSESFPPPSPPPPPPPPPSPPPPSPPPPPFHFGVVDDAGAMRDDFDVGAAAFDLPADDVTGGNETASDRVRVRVRKFPMCPESMREYIPCLDNEEVIRRLNSTERGERFERHCPGEGKGLNCLVRAPIGYKTPIPWPQSRDEVLFSL